MIDVLLVSPRLPPNDARRCGDHAYTDTLLANPPHGVRYWHYEDLIHDGRMRRMRFWQTASYHLTRRGILPPDTWAEYLTTDFSPDLIHIVALAATVRMGNGKRVPTILHASSPSITDLTVKRRWSKEEVARAYRRSRLFYRSASTYHYALNPMDACRILVQTDYGRRLLLDYGRGRAEDVQVLYPALPVKTMDAPGKRTPGKPFTFLFVGTDFERKNGPLVVEAFRRTCEIARSDVRLILVGRPKDGRIIEEKGVEHRLFVDHTELIETVFPVADAFVLPTAAEGSFAFTLFEALSNAIPVITVDAWGMPEIVIDGENGFLVQPGSLDDLADRMNRMASQPELVSHMGQDGLKRFRCKFSIEAHNKQLAGIYDEVLHRS